jgi:phosphatidate cytidylyltransferase
MAHPDSLGWPDPSDRGHDDPYSSRQWARRVDAAPDAYLESRSNGGWDSERDLGFQFDVDRTRSEYGRHAAESADDPWLGLSGPAAPGVERGAAERGDADATSEMTAVTGVAPGLADEAGPVQAADLTEASPTPAPVKKAGGRAGRNLPAAIGVGVALAAVVIASLIFYRHAFLAVVIVAVVVATWEMTRAVRAAGLHPPMVPLIAGGVAMVGLTWYGGAEALVLGLVATAAAALVWRLADGPSGYQRDVMAALLIAVYVPFLGGFAVLLSRPEDGALRVLAALAGVVLSDTGGYAAGVFFGKRPMAPSVSPKKSWEGTAGSLLAAAAGGALMLYFMLDVAWWYGVVFGLAVSAAAVLGDLAESLIKRDLGIKDMSSLLPGHGGLMDRLDSVLFALPTAVAVLALVAPAAT